MKRWFGCMIAVVMVVAFLGAGQVLAADESPVLSLGTPMVKISKKAQVVIMGSGFKPSQEISILITDANGLQTDIGYALKPVPKADDTGTWATTWNAGRFVSKKIVGPGPCKITVTDADYNPVAHTVVFFEKAAKKAKKKK